MCRNLYTGKNKGPAITHRNASFKALPLRSLENSQHLMGLPTMELVLMYSQTQKTEVCCDTVADSRKSSKICHICNFGGSVRVEKIHVNQMHFIRNEIQPSHLSPLTGITMTRNASDQFGRQSGTSFSSVSTAPGYAGHCSQKTESFKR